MHCNQSSPPLQVSSCEGICGLCFRYSFCTFAKQRRRVKIVSQNWTSQELWKERERSHVSDPSKCFRRSAYSHIHQS